MSILIKNGTLVTMNPAREIAQADLLIEEDRITGIGDFPEINADQVINARGKLVIPGLIQTHVHLCQALFRGMANDLELLDWLNQRIWPLEAAHDEESLYFSALLGCGELLRGGTTSIIDMGTVRHTKSIFAAAFRSGIRYLGGKCMMDQGEQNAARLKEDRDLSLQESVDLLEEWEGRENERLRYAFCPRFVLSCSEDLLVQVRNLSEQYQVPVHTHASENKSEIELVQIEKGMRNVFYFDHLGLCNEKLILAHCIHVNNEEIEVLSCNQVKVAHCPSSNLKLASGIAPIPDLIKSKAAVSLGADGAPCNNNLSMWMEMRLAALIQKPFYGPRSMPAPTVFELATLGGARALGREAELGSLEIGKKADVVVVDINHWHNWPTNAADVYAQLVYQVQTADVYCTIVEGRLVMLKGRVLTIPGAEVKRGGEKALSRVAKRAGLH